MLQEHCLLAQAKCVLVIDTGIQDACLFQALCADQSLWLSLWEKWRVGTWKCVKKFLTSFRAAASLLLPALSIEPLKPYLVYCSPQAVVLWTWDHWTKPPAGVARAVYLDLSPEVTPDFSIFSCPCRASFLNWLILRVESTLFAAASLERKIEKIWWSSSSSMSLVKLPSSICFGVAFPSHMWLFLPCGNKVVWTIWVLECQGFAHTFATVSGGTVLASVMRLKHSLNQTGLEMSLE